MTLSLEQINKIEENIANINCNPMVESPLVSIIVPVYNTEKFIAKCLLSLVNQTLKDIEIIVVNDGSTDDTCKIISMFSQKDLRIKVINQENKMQGAARNNGILCAKGEYIGFVDADDWVDLDYYEKLYNAAKKYGSDIALATNVRTGNGKDKKRLSITEEKFVQDLQGRMDICHQWKDGCPTNKIYKSELLLKNNVRFAEGVYCEDKIFTTKALYYANGLVAVPDIYYYYFRNPKSTVNSSKRKLINKHKDDKENARMQCLEFLRENNAQLRDKDFWATKKDLRFFNISIFKIRISLRTIKYYIFGFIKIFERSC